MAFDTDDNPLEQLVELLVYAPIGLLYEYPDVLPQLIKRGKSQVQLARFAGQLAIRQQQAKAGSPSGEPGPTVSPDVLLDGLARLITEVGSAIGLAPPQTPTDEPVSDGSPTASAEPDSVEEPQSSVDDISGDNVDVEETAVAEPKPTTKLPIANYDSLTAKEIIFLLEDLTVSQLRRVLAYERDNRNRKTVVTKIDRLIG